MTNLNLGQSVYVDDNTGGYLGIVSGQPYCDTVKIDHVFGNDFEFVGIDDVYESKQAWIDALMPAWQEKSEYIKTVEDLVRNAYYGDISENEYDARQAYALAANRLLGLDLMIGD